MLDLNVGAPVLAGGMTADQLVNAPAAPASPPDSERYWAARSGTAVIQELQKKERSFFEYAQSRGHVGAWIMAYAQHYGLDPEDLRTWATQTVGFGGDFEELVNFRVNESRSFTDQLVTMAIGTRPSFQCYATNDSYDSLAQAESADRIVDYVYRSRYGERKERLTVERGVLLSLSWTWLRWDKDQGEPLPPVPVIDPATNQPAVQTRKMADGRLQPVLDPKTGEPKTKLKPSGERTGNIALKVLSPWEVFYEPRIEDQDDHLWRCAKERRSKYELASLFPAKAQQILKQAGSDEFSMEALFSMGMAGASLHETDELTVYHFYHLPSPAMATVSYEGLAQGEDEEQLSMGRYLCFVGDVVLRDRPLDHGEIPLVDFMPKAYIGTAFGYSNVWDGISVNQMIDQVISDVSTNLTMFARQSVIVDDASGITPMDLVSGARIIKKKTGSDNPEALQLAAVPESSKWFLDHLQKRLQSIYGLNAVTRGEPDKNVTSGTMAALFHSIAIEVNSGLQAAVDSHRERVANMILNILKVSAQHPMIVALAGHDERDYVDSFTKGDLAGIKGVRVRTANPMMRTQAGRMELAQMLLKVEGAVEDPAQLVEVLVSGTLTPLYDGPRKARLRIKLENEILQDLASTPPKMGPDGMPQQAWIETQEPPRPPLPNGMTPPQPPPYKKVPQVPVLEADEHDLHIKEHYTLLSSRRAMEDPNYAAVILAHCSEHWYVWEQQRPERAIGIDHKPFPRMAPPGAPGPGPGGPPGGPGGQPKPGAGPSGKPPEALKKPGGGPDEDPTGVALPKPATPPGQPH